MKKLFTLIFFIGGVINVQALIISEVMSNPTGPDAGYEWIELYNDSNTGIDISNLVIYTKLDSASTSVASVFGGTSLQSGSYAVVGGVVSSSNLNTYVTNPTGGILLRFVKNVSLTNSNSQYVDIRLNGVIIDKVLSYDAGSDGKTASLINGVFVKDTTPTPGADNQAVASSSSDSGSNATSTNTQQTVQAQSAPSPDIILYMPFEKTVVAGADANFTTYGMTRGGSNIDGLTFSWSYGDGGQGEGTSTLYRYVYPGRYMARVEAGNGHVLGNASMKIHVVSPDIAITKVDTSKYGLYVDIYNPNNYELDLSQWKLSFDGRAFPFPKNTIILGGETTRFSGLAMGFASTTVNQNSVVRILFPNLEEVTSYIIPNSINSNLVDSLNTSRGVVAGVSTSTLSIISNKILEKVSNSTSTKILNKIITKQSSASQNTSTPPTSVSSKTSSSTATLLTNQSSKAKDTRLITWFKSLFGL